MKIRCLPGLLAGAALLAALVLPASAEGYDTTLDSLSRLQTLAESYAETSNAEDDPIELTLSYTRTGVYNDKIWTFTAGPRDPEFESYVSQNDPGLAALQAAGTVDTPAGTVDFAHLLASMNLVYRGLPITGSWGGDCMQLAQQYGGQAANAEGYASLMAGSFDQDGSESTFSGADLNADLDSILIGAQLTKGADLAGLIQNYYSGISEHDRAYQFIALSFGSVDTGNTQAFRQKVYDTLVGDTGMQLLLYLNGMMDSSTWTVQEQYVPALQGACYVFADYLASAVGNERVDGSGDTLMMTMASQALSEALAEMGDQQAANAVQSNAAQGEASSQQSSSSVSSVLTSAASTLQNGFSLQIFQIVLLVIGAGALLLLLISIAMLVRRR